jgi:putative flippase GtrA
MTKYHIFVKFLFNGGIIDLISWLIQMVFYWMAVLFLPSLNYKIAISICLSFIIALFINFFTLKKNVFKSGGLFYRFVIITASVMIVVGLLSEIMSNNLSSIYPNIAPYIAYPLVALIMALVSSKESQAPIVSIYKVCGVIFGVIQDNFINKNYNIYSHMIKLEDLIKALIQINSKKKHLLKINGYFILYVMKIIESIGVKLPVSSDNLSGFIANQKYSVKSDIVEFGDDYSLDLIIKKAV